MYFALGALKFLLQGSTFLNRSNRRSIVQWYFPFKCSLLLLWKCFMAIARVKTFL